MAKTKTNIVYTRRGDDGRHTAYSADTDKPISASLSGWKSATRLWDFLQTKGYQVTKAPRPTATAPAADSPAKALGLPTGSADFFAALANDAGNWSGNPWIDGNISAGRSAPGYVTRLVQAGLIGVGHDGSQAYAIFTPRGVAAAAKIGVDLSWIDTSHDSAFTAAQPQPETTTPEENTMTTIVKRGAGRPAAAASRTRHAQRTPLPPKAEKRDAQQVETTTRKRRAAVTGSEESPNPTRPAGSCQICGQSHRQGSAIEMRHAAEFKAQQTEANRSATRASRTATRKGTAKAAERAPKGVAERPAGTRKGRPSATAKELPEDFPGRSKAMRLLDGPAQEAGWVGSVKVTDAKTGAAEVSITKGDETMTWFCVDGKQDPAQAPRYTDGRRTVQMKNIAAILAQATGERAWIKPETAKAPRKSAAKRTTTPDEPVKQALPFDVELASEREIASALQGRSVTWQNRISGAVESAVLASRAKVRLEIHPTTRERMVTFSDATATGTRTVRLANILNIK